LKGLNDIEDYLKRDFNSRDRGNFYRIRRRMKDAKIVISENRKQDIDRLIELNRANFGAESSFNNPHRCQIYQDLVDSDFDDVMFSVLIGGEIEGVSFGIKYGDNFVSLNAGVNKRKFKNLGSYMLLMRIAKAIDLKCSIYDAGVGDLGWKEHWHFKKIPQYVFRVN